MANSAGLWFPIIFSDNCDGCAKTGKPRCVEFCPHEVFDMRKGKAIVARPLKCMPGCTACEPVCHTKAISFPQRTTTSSLAKSENMGLIRKTNCPKCGKTYWTNRENDICFDCEKQK